MRHGPDRPNWAPLLIIRERHIVTTTFLVELPLEVDPIICTGIVGTCNYFGRICGSRGLSNLTPTRSRLFKLMGMDKAKYMWSCSKRLAYVVANLYAKESEKRANGTVVN